MDLDLKGRERSVRTLLLSDVHLGYRFAQTENLLKYLNQIRPEQLYILGDFIDGWEFRAKWRWMRLYSQILERLFDLAEGGTELYYTPGNHDAFLRDPQVSRMLRKSGLCANVREEFIFETQDGRSFILLHGDRFDVVETHYQSLSVMLSYVYEPMLNLNARIHRMTRRPGSPYSACAFIKKKAKTVVRFLSHFEDELFRYVRNRGCDGVICGHIHSPVVATSSATTYINTGDWVEHCTALVEHHDGDLVLESFYPVAPSLQPQRSRPFHSGDIPEHAFEHELAFVDGCAQLS